MRVAAALTVVLWSLPALAVEQVRIAVADGLGRTQVTGSGLERSAWGDDEQFTALHKDKVWVEWKKGQVTVDGKEVGTAVRFKADGIVNVKGFAMRGTVDIKGTPQGLLVVNAIPLEDYLAAVLGGEMPANFPEEALKAQAIAARTYAVQRKLDAFGKPYHMGSTVLSQVYGGAGREDPRTRRAVDATRGLVLTYDLAPIEAYFHASCGGRTETGFQALGRELPYLQSVDCPCERDPKTHWTVTIPGKAIEKDFHLDPSELRVASRTKTGRVVSLADSGHHVDAVSFRRVLGYDQVKSLAFSVEREGSSLKLTGKGFGHGAGLCQVGARLLAEQGWDYERILAHYYPGTDLQRMY
jgi:stage II sporulation protein D